VAAGNSPTDTVVVEHVLRTIVHPRWFFQEDLRITLLQPRAPGGIFSPSGDIDNRLKTLFDALARPRHAQDVPGQWKPGPGEEPVCCLLEDDSLIKRISVDTDELLAPQSPSHVKLFIGVRIQTARTFGGFAILAP